MRRTGLPMVIAFRSMAPLGDCRTVASRAVYCWGEGILHVRRNFDDQIAMRGICCGRYAAIRGTLVPLRQPSVVGNAVSGDRGGRQRGPWLRDLFSPRLGSVSATIVPEVVRAGCSLRPVCRSDRNWPAAGRTSGFLLVAHRPDGDGLLRWWLERCSTASDCILEALPVSLACPRSVDLTARLADC